MLPGFRFLFAAVVLTASLLVFGLGASALLRASHERSASLLAHPGPAPAFTWASAAPPSLAMLRVEPASVEALPPEALILSSDTLMPTDKIAALGTAVQVEEIVQPPVTVESTSEAKDQRAAADTKVELGVDIQEAMIELAPTQAIQPIADMAAIAALVETKPAEAMAVAPIETPTRSETPLPIPPPVIALQQVATLPASEINGSTSGSTISDPPLVNARPIRRPPVPAARPAAADAVAALPDPAFVGPAIETPNPITRKRKPVVKRVVATKRRVVTRPQPQRPTALNAASPFGAQGLGAQGFGAQGFGASSFAR